MEKMVDDGLVRHLGVSNFSLKQVEELLEHARIKPVANQIELHPFLAQRKMIGVCARKVWPLLQLTLPETPSPPFCPAFPFAPLWERLAPAPQGCRSISFFCVPIPSCCLLALHVMPIRRLFGLSRLLAAQARLLLLGGNKLASMHQVQPGKSNVLRCCLYIQGTVQSPLLL